MEIRMLGMDFDGTLVDYSHGKPFISRNLLDWLTNYIEAGNYAGIVTGRSIQEMKDIAGCAGLVWGEPFPSFCIHRESYISLNKNGRDISFREYNEPALKRISELMLILGGHASRLYGLLRENGLSIDSWNLFGDFGLEFELHDIQQAQTAVRLLERYLTETGVSGCQVHRNSRSATIIEGNSGKGNVLLRASQYFCLMPSEVLAIGDSINDLSMVDGSRGFTGACVGNGDEMLKKAVLAGGGYIGNGTASLGILDIIGQLTAAGRLKNYFKGVKNIENKCLV